jgi:hypothetical protein
MPKHSKMFSLPITRQRAESFCIGFCCECDGCFWGNKPTNNDIFDKLREAAVKAYNEALRSNSIDIHHCMTPERKPFRMHSITFDYAGATWSLRLMWTASKFTNGILQGFCVPPE